jgi:hypothetical protein
MSPTVEGLDGVSVAARRNPVTVEHASLNSGACISVFDPLYSLEIP